MTLVTIPTPGTQYEVVRTDTGLEPRVVGFVCCQPWTQPRTYAVYTLDGRVVRAGMGLEAAKEWALLRTDWG